MQLRTLVDASTRVGATRKRLEKTALLAELLRALNPDEIAIAVGFLTGELRQGKIGVGWSAVKTVSTESAPAADETLALHEVDDTFTHIAETGGKGSAGERGRLLRGLFERATEAERRFLGALIVGEIRQGALASLMVDAIAKAASLPVGDVRRAWMLANDPGKVAHAALTGGAADLAAFQLTLFRPVLPMLAHTAESADEAVATIGGVSALEYKLDGARVQVHKSGDDVRVYTRGLNEVTAAVPEVVELVRGIGTDAAILDGETIALRSDGRPLPFQVTMKRFGRKLDVAEVRAQLPLDVFFFDCLRSGDDSLIDRTLRERVAAMCEVVPADALIPRIETADPARASAFLAEAMARGHEGIMAKSLEASYEAGARGKGWLKVKPAHTLDLVVLAAEWGSGRRKGKLSNLHLGARDPATGSFVMLGKTFKGLTDKLLAWQTEALLARQVGREGHIVHVRPELVVEIAFNDVQASTQYPGGVALRFARVKRYRDDKTASEADTIDAVRAIHAAATGGG